MRPLSHAALCSVLALTLAACGGGSSGGPGPSPTPTPQSLAISPGTSSLRVNQTEAFSGTITLSNGTTQSVQPTWQSDNVTVLTFDGGTARGRANGTATIIATSQGLTSTRLIRVYTDYLGTWVGDYIVRRCDESGAFAGSEFCDRENGIQVGDQLQMSLDLLQQAEAVNGDMALGGVEGTVSGTIDTNGRLNATGTLTFTVEGVTLVFAVNPMSVNGEGDRLTGRFTATITAPGVSGQVVLEGELSTVARVSSGSSTLSRRGTPASGTMRDFLRAIRQSQ